MISLFSARGLKSLGKILDGQTLFAFDFDGTLSPIVKKPEAARLVRGAERRLRELDRKAPVAVVSGRGLKDLRSKFDFRPRYLVGNHGVEGAGLRKEKEESLGACRIWKKQLAAMPLPAGVRLEDKKYSLTLHYREAGAAAAEKVAALLRHLKPRPQVIGGKFVLNLLHPKAPHKGHALQSLLKESGRKRVFYIGDDDTDEKVFAMKKRNFFCVRVGKRASSSADFFIESPREINRLLEILLREGETK